MGWRFTKETDELIHQLMPSFDQRLIMISLGVLHVEMLVKQDTEGRGRECYKGSRKLKKSLIGLLKFDLKYEDTIPS